MSPHYQNKQKIVKSLHIKSKNLSRHSKVNTLLHKDRFLF
jgi:hypothetical protein